MSVLTFIFTYVLVWWVVLFAVLPWGNRQPDLPEEGMAYGAPSNPNIKKKLIATSLVSLLVVLLIYIINAFNIIDFREVAREMDNRIYGDRTISSD